MPQDTTNPSQPISIRPRTAQDLPACISILRRVYSLDKYPIQGTSNATSFLAFATLEQAFVATTSDGIIIGHVAIGTASDDDVAVKLWRSQHPETEVAVLERLFVDPDSRGSGAAARLIEAATAWNKEWERRLVFFLLYRRLGWVQFGVGSYAYGDGESMDALCFVSPA
ncbi:hypothetical protein CLAFUW4_10995 [Fulvia fulva]|uniref:N-acetyltransferase domain-containing protein n=1 Tax=Passalora fulva TaxID=5499 RepID=A0A9Q8US10_PASFU|nr:uncharacterized protein CLAFUR5_10038 [Fulvia fulva]KAK4619346.1 hypothetical protein CLAFUR4_11000 [Fulvia fulva]KAK4620891.1 hypothetical protein CLAFUR0_11007 [Fulvia fulva]UJO20290.1 hypothetical protein CLAFUR5_10038 [Fulvia fulva]WPV17566.1 hypothetical protein CLAFUW4_10995 [Fulvia fulva]WPV32339.1 hypothetical protein CLAFUW7_10993 [Fulvia fulva]